MSYSPTTWESGDVISSAKLNKIEQGIANAGGGGGSNVVVVGVEVVNTEDGATATFDKTFAELKTAHESGATILCNIAIADEVSNIFGFTLSFLIHHAEQQFPFPSPEQFNFDAPYIDSEAAHCCYVGGDISENATHGNVRVASLGS